MRKFKKFYTMALIGLFFFVSFSILIGCQTTSNRYIGKVVPDSNRISIPKGKPQSGVWQTKDLDFQYTGSWDGQLSLTGELTLDKSYEKYKRLEYLYLWIHYLDSDGNILDSKLAWSVVSQITYTGGEKKWSVNSELDVPSNFTAVTFSYMGEVLEDKGGGTRWRFYKSPIS